MEQIKLDDLHVLDYNPRTIGKQELDRLKKSIREHTLAIPEEERGKGYRLVSTVTVNLQGNRIIGGHQRIRALEELGQGWIDKRDITYVDLVPDSPQEKALNLTLNDPNFAGSWDDKQRQILVQDIINSEVDLSDFGLDFFEIKEPDQPKQRVEKEQPEPSEPELNTGDESELFPMSYAVTAEQRTTMMQAIEKARETTGCETSAEALTTVCVHYLNQ